MSFGTGTFLHCPGQAPCPWALESRFVLLPAAPVLHHSARLGAGLPAQLGLVSLSPACRGHAVASRPDRTEGDPGLCPQLPREHSSGGGTTLLPRQSRGHSTPAAQTRGREGRRQHEQGRAGPACAGTQCGRKRTPHCRALGLGGSVPSSARRSIPSGPHTSAIQRSSVSPV